MWRRDGDWLRGGAPLFPSAAEWNGEDFELLPSDAFPPAVPRRSSRPPDNCSDF